MVEAVAVEKTPAEASIGPGGIEMVKESSTQQYRTLLQSDRKKLK